LAAQGVSPPPPVTPVPSVEAALAEATTSTAALDATMKRASAFTADDQHRRVNDEWSTVESLRHVVLVVDVWLSRAVLGVDDPFHPMALPPHFMPSKLPGSSIDPDAKPTFDEACEVVRERLDAVRSYVDNLRPEELERPVNNHAKTVGGALNVLFSELQAHNYFINRDLDVIEAGREG
jgi:hypothetical protein